ncbi:AsmA family protein [Wolbachia endosymbiont of Dirofilaria (Dirofilaria) immitis]|uniref:AsmA-like C-terminal region-containing protein n=1 Tax=Wolbachia endosymbiont of Dirofilaria (Dirofilaria) immitis TaxID=1812115 RepID=UPI00158BF211|nr:AsmA-like C-terminal region-containing protein [Wolbachia endosymbiont of Dirofilaria (Dirofilaria) immitis]QKX02478.1 hypothetical protein GOY12_02870 [Wolbachia endosymbiont of Dirofilaria (Dirofilaria) immitis]
MRLFIYIILSISLVLTILHIVTIFKDWDSYKELIVQKLENNYNAKIYIGGKIEVSLITPKLTIDNVYVQCLDDEKQKLSDLISINRIEVRPSFLSFFLFSLQPKSITLFGMKGSKKNFTGIINGRASKIDVDVVIKDSKINLNNNFADYRSIVGIKEVAIKKDGHFFGKVKVDDNSYNFLGKVNITKKNVYINAKSNFGNVLFEGNRNQEWLHGKLMLSIDNSSSFVDDLAKVVGLSFFTYVVPSENVEMSSNISFNRSEFIATDLKIDSKSIQASGAVRNDKRNNHTNVDINFSKVDLGFVQDGSRKTVGIKDLLECFRKVIPKNLNLDFNIEALSIQYQNRILDKFHAMLKFADGKIKVDMLLQLPGVNNVSCLSGEVSNNLILSEFDGDLLVKGDDFESFISCFFPSIKMRENKRNQFTISSRLHFAPRIFSISDIKLLNDEEFWRGSVKVNYTKKHNAISGRFSVYNFDVNKYDYLLLSDLSRMQWLKNLRYDVNMKINVNNFMFNGIKVEDLGFLLNIEKGRLVAGKIKLFGEDFNVTGSVKILADQKYTKPLLNVSLTGDRFNGDILKLPNLIEVKKGLRNKIDQVQWSTEQFNFLDGKEGFDANVQINVINLKAGEGILKDFNLDAVVINNTITIKKVNYVLEHGQVSFQGYLRLDSMYIKFFIVDLDTKRVGQVIGIDNLSGKINLNGEIKAQGKSFYNWANTLSGEVNLQAQGIEFANVDFNSFITDLFSSKNKSGISTLTHISIYNGSTVFKNISGKANIKNGICSTSLQFEIDQASGSVSSNLTLSSFALISLSRFFFIPPGHSNPIYVDVHLDGPIWHPRMSFDEDLIFNTIIGKGGS